MKPRKKTKSLHRGSPFTVLISGNDTGVGKTHVLGLVARALAQRGHKIEIVKAVETGVRAREKGDADRASAVANHANATHRTLFRFRQPLAPLAAAKADGSRFTLAALLRALNNTPAVNCRLVEGAGGLAVPIDSKGCDWADFASAIRADITLLVVEDRLGAINQARLLATYAAAKEVPNCCFILNRLRSSSSAVHRSNRQGLRASGIRLFPSPEAVASFLSRSITRAGQATRTR
ncbi:MAG: dethiobiotin synthase [Nibricoccus sp.]